MPAPSPTPTYLGHVTHRSPTNGEPPTSLFLPGPLSSSLSATCKVRGNRSLPQLSRRCSSTTRCLVVSSKMPRKILGSNPQQSKSPSLCLPPPDINQPPSQKKKPKSSTLGRPPLKQTREIPPLPAKHAKISKQVVQKMKQLRTLAQNSQASLRYRRRKKQQFEESFATLKTVEQANQFLKTKKLQLEDSLARMKSCLKLHANSGCTTCQEIKLKASLTSECAPLLPTSAVQPMVIIKQECADFLDMGHLFDP